MAQFPCETKVHDCIHVSETSTCGFEVHDFEVCCAAIWLHDVYNITVKGIHIAVSKNVSGVVLRNISWITVQLTTSCFLTNRKCLGIAIYEGTSVNVHSSSANNCSFGLVLRNTTNAHIMNAVAMHSEIVGVTLHMTRNTYITNTITMYSGGVECTYTGWMTLISPAQLQHTINGMESTYSL